MARAAFAEQQVAFRVQDPPIHQRVETAPPDGHRLAPFKDEGLKPGRGKVMGREQAAGAQPDDGRLQGLLPFGDGKPRSLGRQRDVFFLMARDEPGFIPFDRQVDRENKFDAGFVARIEALSADAPGDHLIRTE